jgi:hypothetical protein
MVNIWLMMVNNIWLLVEPHPSEKYESVGMIFHSQLTGKIIHSCSKPTREFSGYGVLDETSVEWDDSGGSSYCGTSPTHVSHVLRPDAWPFPLEKEHSRDLLHMANTST